MLQISIEKADRKRYSLMVWQTIGFGLFLAAFIFFPDGGRFGGNGIIEFIRGFGVGLALAVTFKLSWFDRKIKENKEVAEALSNEMYRDYNKKALGIGFYAAMVTAFVLFVVSMAGIDIRLAAGIVMYLGLMGARVAQLIYYR